MAYFDPLNKFYKSVTGAVSEGEKVVFRVRGDFSFCNLIVLRDGDTHKNAFSMDKKGDFFEKEISFSCGLYNYAFAVDNGAYIGLGENYSGKLFPEFVGFQLSVYAEDYVTPDWLTGGVIYQIFPDRFNIGDKDKTVGSGKVLRKDTFGTPHFEPDAQGKVLNNDFFGGDFKGIECKLDYLSSLGVTAVYLNPIFKAYSNHRYDTGDYESIDEFLGGEEGFKSLISEGEKRGIKFIIDGVFNHTGDDSVYFNKYGTYDSVGAFQSEKSRYYKWYKFIEYPEIYESWWGISILPALDKTNPDYVDFITGENGIIEKYTEMGIGGWRLDVVDELPDEFVKKIRRALKRINNNAVLIGEVWEDASNKVSYGVRREYFLGNELDSVMNYPLKDAIIDFVINGNAKRLEYVIKEQIDHYPSCALNLLMNILSTHDTFRLISAVGDANVSGKTKAELSQIKLTGNELEIAKKRVKIAALLQYTLYGVPSLYYGDEIGMQGYSDPLNRAFFKWNEIDEDLLSFYKSLGALRKNYSVFMGGDIDIKLVSDGFFSFKRADLNCELFVAVNVGKKPKTLLFEGELTDVLSGKNVKDQLTLNTYEFAVLIHE